MKVLQINCVCGYGSTGRIAEDLAKVLINDGGDAFVCFGREDYSGPVPHLKTCSSLTNYIDGAFSRLFDMHGTTAFTSTKRTINKIKEFKPDIVHLHNIHGYYLNYKMLFEFLKEYNKPVVWTLHDSWNYTGHCAYYIDKNCEKWKTECFDCPNTAEYPKAFIDNSKNNFIRKKTAFCGLNNLTIITPSKWLAEDTKKSFLGYAKIGVINNGIDTNVFKPAPSEFKKKYNIENKKIVLGVSSFWNKNKGLYDFAKLAQMLPEEYKIVMVGLTKEQEKIVGENVIGVARTNSTQELAEIYTAADYFVNLTYQDNFPTTNLEALCCGTPVITYKTGGSPEAVAKGCGAVTPVGDLEAVKKAVAKEYDSAVILQHAKNFDKEIRFKEYLKLYKEILK